MAATLWGNSSSLERLSPLKCTHWVLWFLAGFTQVISPFSSTLEFPAHLVSLFSIQPCVLSHPTIMDNYCDWASSESIWKTDTFRLVLHSFPLSIIKLLRDTLVFSAGPARNTLPITPTITLFPSLGLAVLLILGKDWALDLSCPLLITASCPQCEYLDSISEGFWSLSAFYSY